MPTTLSLEQRPPVHPSLVEHLRRAFTPKTVSSFDPSAVFARNWEQIGVEGVIAYLETLLPDEAREALAKEHTHNEFLQAEDEHPGPDPRRPAPRGRS